MRTGAIFFCAVLLVVAGCAQVPRPTTFPYSFQQQLQSATHWQLIAKSTTERLNMVDVLFKRKPDGSRPRIYIQTSDESPFGEAFRKYLITELITGKFALSNTEDDGDIRIYWDLQLVRRNVERPKPWLPGVPAIVVGAVATVLTGPGWDTTDARVPHTELILTTRVTVGKDSLTNTIESYSDTFYINDREWNYWLPCKPVTFTVVSR